MHNLYSFSNIIICVLNNYFNNFLHKFENYAKVYSINFIFCITFLIFFLFLFKLYNITNICKLINKIIFEDEIKYKSKSITISNKSAELYKAIKWFISNNSTKYDYNTNKIIKNLKIKKKYIKLVNNDFILLFLSNNNSCILNSNKIVLIFKKFKNENVINNFLKKCIIQYNNYLIGNSISKKYINNSNDWIEKEIKIINMNSIILNNDFKIKIINDFQDFFNSKNKYNFFNIPFKKIYLFYGPSGTGKSSFVNAIASYLNYQLYYLDLNNIDSELDLTILLNNINSIKNIILVVENICIDNDSHTENSLLNSCIKNTEFSNKSKILKFLNIIYNYNSSAKLIILTTRSYYEIFDDFINDKYEFTNCSMQQFKQLYLLFYNNILPSTILNKINTNIYSPEQLIKIYLNNTKSEYKFLLHINKFNKINLENDINNYFNKCSSLIIHKYNIFKLIIVLTHFNNLLNSSSFKKYQYRLNFINKFKDYNNNLLSDDEISCD